MNRTRTRIDPQALLDDLVWFFNDSSLILAAEHYALATPYVDAPDRLAGTARHRRIWARLMAHPKAADVLQLALTARRPETPQDRFPGLSRVLGGKSAEKDAEALVGQAMGGLK